MSLPRLHPDDLLEISNNVSNNVLEKLDFLFNKKDVVSNMQTLTVKDVAKILNRDETTILRYIKARNPKIKATKTGKDWIITQQSLIDFTNGV